MKTRKGIPLSIPFPIGAGGGKAGLRGAESGRQRHRPRKIELDASYSYVRAVYVISRCWSVSTRCCDRQMQRFPRFPKKCP